MKIIIYIIISSYIIYAASNRIYYDDYINSNIERFFNNNGSQVYPIKANLFVEKNKFSKIPYNKINFTDSNITAGIGGKIITKSSFFGEHDKNKNYSVLTGYSGILYLKTKKLSLDARFTNNLEYYNANIIKSWSKKNYKSPFYGTNSKNINGGLTNKKIFDNNFLHLNYQFSNSLFAEIGHDKLSMGPQFFSSLCMSDSSNQYDYYLVEKKLPKNFTFLFGLAALVSDSALESKYIAFHKLSWSYKFINISFYESSIFSNRFPMMYIVPILPFFVSEHYYGDLDNKAMGTDISLFVKGFKIFGSLFLDDLYSLTPSSFTSDNWWGNKWAVSYGIGYLKKLKNNFYLDFMTELNHIEPWVYTHDQNINYTHYGKELGVSTGSDSKNLRLEFDFGKLSLFSSKIYYYTFEKGPISSFDVHDYNVDGESKKFISEIVNSDEIIGTKQKFSFNIHNIYIKPYIKFDYSFTNKSSYSGVGCEFLY